MTRYAADRLREQMSNCGIEKDDQNEIIVESKDGCLLIEGSDQMLLDQCRWIIHGQTSAGKDNSCCGDKENTLLVNGDQVGAILGFEGKATLARYLKGKGPLLTSNQRVVYGEKGSLVIHKSINSENNLKNELIEETISPFKFQLELDTNEACTLLKSSKLSKILASYSASCQVVQGLVWVCGMDEESVDGCVRECYSLLFDHQYCTLPLYDCKVEMNDVYAISHCENIEFCVDNEQISLWGHKDNIAIALGRLQVKNDSKNISLTHLQSKDARDFVTGKKDGKLVKIMKEKQVFLKIEDYNEHLLRFEVQANCLQKLFVGFEALQGEMPVECKFWIDYNEHKRLIGHSGSNIQRIMKQFAVYVRFTDKIETARKCGHLRWKAKNPSLQYFEENVLVRTPQKNHEALAQAKAAILAMREYKHCEIQETLLDLDLCKVSRKFVQKIISDFDLEFTLSSKLVEENEECQVKPGLFARGPSTVIEALQAKIASASPPSSPRMKKKSRPSPIFFDAFPSSLLLSPPNSPEMKHKPFNPTVGGKDDDNTALFKNFDIKKQSLLFSEYMI